MLEACHERVQRTLALQQRLCEHLQTKGCDASARSAARDVLRYFDVAAPLHHQDEELHVFPALLSERAGDAPLLALVQTMQSDHIAMSELWSKARESLKAIESNEATLLSAADEALFDAFVQRYAQHLQSEDAIIYPAARAAVSEADLAAMGREMAGRRSR